MSILISGNYQKLEPGEVEDVAHQFADAWKNAEIPMRQYELAAKSELEAFRRGNRSGPFGVLARCLLSLPAEALDNVLDIGAAGGYHRELMHLSGIQGSYTAVDYSEAFKDLALRLYPDMAYDIADARALPYRDGEFATVISGACIMHIREYAKAIAESARVARRFVIMHRTPVYAVQPTTFFTKSAYDVPCLEVHFNEGELLDIFADCGLKLRHTEMMFWNMTESFGHRTYILEKQSSELMHHPV